MSAIAGKPAPTVDRISKLERGHCGSWLACDEVNSVYLTTYFFFFGFKYLVRPWNQITSAGLPLIWIDLS